MSSPLSKSSGSRSFKGTEQRILRYSNSSNIEHEEDKSQEINEALHEERNSFYSNLAESMDEIQYELFSKWRTQNFLSKIKDTLIEWINVKWTKILLNLLLIYHLMKFVLLLSRQLEYLMRIINCIKFRIL